MVLLLCQNPTEKKGWRKKNQCPPSPTAASASQAETFKYKRQHMHPQTAGGRLTHHRVFLTTWIWFLIFFFSLRKQNSALDICDKSERICGTSKVQREFPDVIYSSCHNNRVDKIPPLFLQVYVRTERRSVKENLQWKVDLLSWTQRWHNRRNWRK